MIIPKAHPCPFFAALEQNNLTTTCGYSMDPFCDEARAAIRARFACPAADVHFSSAAPSPTRPSSPRRCGPVGGGVIAADTGHQRP